MMKSNSIMKTSIKGRPVSSKRVTAKTSAAFDLYNGYSNKLEYAALQNKSNWFCSKSRKCRLSLAYNDEPYSVNKSHNPVLSHNTSNILCKNNFETMKTDNQVNNYCDINFEHDKISSKISNALFNKKLNAKDRLKLKTAINKEIYEWSQVQKLRCYTSQDKKKVQFNNHHRLLSKERYKLKMNQSHMQRFEDKRSNITSKSHMLLNQNVVNKNELKNHKKIDPKLKETLNQHSSWVDLHTPQFDNSNSKIIPKSTNNAKI